MSQANDFELDVAYSANNHLDHCVLAGKQTNIVQRSDFIFMTLKGHDHDEAIEINSKYVVIARYDMNQYVSPPMMKVFGIFSSMGEAKDRMTKWAINKGLGNEFLATCTYDWVMIDEVLVQSKS